MQLTKEQVNLFRTALLNLVRNDLPLPDELETERFYRMAKFRNLEYNSRGYEDLRFIILQNEEGKLYLDYYFIWDDGDSHKRIDETGAVIRLENMEGHWGWPIYEDEEETKKEHARMKANNENVRAILQRKGLDGVDEQGNPLYETSSLLIKSEWFLESRKQVKKS